MLYLLKSKTKIYLISFFEGISTQQAAAVLQPANEWDYNLSMKMHLYLKTISILFVNLSVQNREGKKDSCSEKKNKPNIVQHSPCQLKNNFPSYVSNK